MSTIVTIQLRLPATVLAKVEELAAREEISVDEFLARAATEKVEALMLEELAERARRGSRKTYREVLDKVPDVEPDEFDRL